MRRLHRTALSLSLLGSTFLVLMFTFFPGLALAAPAQKNSSPAPAVAWPVLTLQPFASGIANPAVIANTRDGTGRVVVASQNGQLWVIQGGSVLPAPFLDLSSKVLVNGTSGMGGLVFSPLYALNGFFYVDYVDLSDNLVLARYHVSATNPNLADPTTATTILQMPIPTAYAGMSAGHLAFGVDDTLYIGTGAAASAGGDPLNLSQSLNSLFGKILRLDVETPGCTTNPLKTPNNYCIPPNNPFAGGGGSPEIWASGLRNPWMFTFDTQTWDLYIADVGENREEEIDFQPAASRGGENYGWSILEGSLCYNPSTGCVPPSGYAAPVAEYSHGTSDSTGCAVIGGFVYHGQSFPALQGLYFYGDYCSGRIWGMQLSNGTWQTTQLAQEPFQITAFGLEQNGEELVADATNGIIYQLVGSAPAATPTPTLPSPVPSPTPTSTPTSTPIVGGSPNKMIFLPVIGR